jgi:hypothetical protein
MTQVIVNGNTYSDDGSSSKDMRYGGHRQWLLPMISDTMVVINSILGGSFVVSFVHVRPVSGATIAAATGQGAFIIDPAATIAALNVHVPPGPAAGQIFELSTSQAITAINVTSTDSGVTVEGGTDLLTAGGGMAWRYNDTDHTWYRRY